MHGFFAILICWLPFTGHLDLCDECDADLVAKARIMAVLSADSCDVAEDVIDQELQAKAFCDPKTHYTISPDLPGVWNTAGVACMIVGQKVLRPDCAEVKWEDNCEGL